MKDGAFISYRRDRGSHLARLLKQALEGPTLDVFLDVDDLGVGHFDDNLLFEIERRDSFIVVLTPGCLDRCHEEGDYFRREIEAAIELKRRIVPVVADGFHWPEARLIPESIRDLSRHNDVEYSHRQWDSVLRKLRDKLRSPSGPFRIALETSPERFDTCMSVLLPYVMVANGGTLEGIEFRRLQPRVTAESEYDGLLESMHAARLILFDLDTAPLPAFQFRLGVGLALSMPIGLAWFDSDSDVDGFRLSHGARLPKFAFESESWSLSQHPQSPRHALLRLCAVLDRLGIRGSGLKEEREWLLRDLSSRPGVGVNLSHAFALARANLSCGFALSELRTCLAVFVQLAGRSAQSGSVRSISECADRLFECMEVLPERCVAESAYLPARMLLDHYVSILRALAASNAAVALDGWADQLDRSLGPRKG